MGEGGGGYSLAKRGTLDGGEGAVYTTFFCRFNQKNLNLIKNLNVLSFFINLIKKI